MYDRMFSPALFAIWLVIGFAFGAFWYALFGYPTGWVLWSGLFVLFFASIPLEAALERRHRRRIAGKTRKAHGL